MGPLAAPSFVSSWDGVFLTFAARLAALLSRIKKNSHFITITINATAAATTATTAGRCGAGDARRVVKMLAGAGTSLHMSAVAVATVTCSTH